MARRFKRTEIVGGFDALKAAQRAQQEKTSRWKKAAASEEAAPRLRPAAHPDKIAARIDHTAFPTKYELTCYECDFQFQLAGRSKTTYCPKCRKLLEIIDYTIDGVWTETVKTAGTIHLTAEGVLKGGELKGTDVILDGRVQGGTVRAFRWLELGANATFREQDVSGRDLRVAVNARHALRRKAAYRHVEVLGTLKAKVHASGLIRIEAGGCLEGEIHGAHLQVAEGGGLRANIRVAAELSAAPAEPETGVPLKKSA